jgi:uncharacterized OB-fold protein
MDSATPVLNALNAPFWTAAQAGRLVLPCCVQTGRLFWPPSPFSPFQTGGVVEWRPAAPEGKLLARAIYRRTFLKKFEPLMPYAIGLVELDAGPRLQAFIAHPDGIGAPKAGERVRLRFEQIVENSPVLTATALAAAHMS